MNLRRIKPTSVAMLTLAALLLASCSNRNMERLVRENLSFAVEQYRYMSTLVPPDVMPRTWDSINGRLVTSNTSWWTSGFYPGTLWMLYEHSGDQELLNEAEGRLKILEKEKYFTGNHDVGFMIFNSFGQAYRIMGNPEYKEVIDIAAGSLSTRFRPSIGSIQSWEGGSRYSCPVIIDNMMNLELLCWVSGNGGDPRYREIAEVHAKTTLNYHFRPDFSSYHVVDFDTAAGVMLRQVTNQGAFDESAWARGQSWGLYGFTMMYRMTGDAVYLERALKIADFLLNHPNMPDDGIPYWDYNAPEIPQTYRDVSAAAIMASALLELGQYTEGNEGKNFLGAATRIITSLSSGKYRSAAGENGGFILMHSVGSLPGKSEVDVPLTYADYYFVEALMRYKKWYM
jgi:unsaturated chondroitin disaccharide hydrolase